MTGPLTTVAELAAALPDTTVLDVRYRTGGPDGRAEHARGHVPGASYIDLDTDLAGPPGDGGRHPLPAPERFAEAMRRAGVSNSVPVVVYDDWAGRAAARAWWLLRLHGHRDVRVLDGGWAAWQRAGQPVESGPTTPVPGDFTIGDGLHMPLVDADAVPGVAVLIDARAPERFRGEVEPIDPVAGHVPGALNVPTDANLDEDGHFLPAERLREVYGRVGASDGADVAAYCGSGVTAAHAVLAMEVAGVRAALYPGSWSHWVGDPSRPVATGPSPT